MSERDEWKHSPCLTTAVGSAVQKGGPRSLLPSAVPDNYEIINVRNRASEMPDAPWRTLALFLTAPVFC